MTLIFVALGSAADYGSFGWLLLLFFTVVCWAFQFGFMAIKHAYQWKAAMAIYIISYIAYGATLVFYAAIFPRLARYMPDVRKAREWDLKEGKISNKEYDQIESLEKNHLSNISTAHSNIGYLLTLVINLSVLIPLQGDSYSNNLALLLTNFCKHPLNLKISSLADRDIDWVGLGIWWFIFQQKRPGPNLPKGSSYLTIGWKQVFLALKEVRQLPQTFLYLIAFFLLSDGLNTTGTLVSIIQNQQVKFSFLQLTYLGLAQAVCSTASTFGFWYFQKYFKIRTKPMFIVTNVFSVFIPFYGMIGLWTGRAGFHSKVY
jgi:MFS-type transporter involved in bile tolerance (Atg22 family)